MGRKLRFNVVPLAAHVQAVGLDLDGQMLVVKY
jgi:hypothetical protein